PVAGAPAPAARGVPPEQRPVPYTATRLAGDPDLRKIIEDQKIEYDAVADGGLGDVFWTWLAPIALGLIFWSWMIRRMAGPIGQGPPGIMAFGKSKARVHVEPDTGVSFQDVAGIEEAVEELREIVEFLKTPEEYRRLG